MGDTSASPSEARGHTLNRLRQLLAEAGVRPRKDLGQCFLIDLNLLRRVVVLADLRNTDAVLEVGTGTGSLTELLSQEAGVVVSVEIDRGLYTIARSVLTGLQNVVLLRCDALKSKHETHPLVLTSLNAAMDAFGCTSRKLVANLPYNIATPLIVNLLYGLQPWDRMVVMTQLELAEKLAAGPGHPEYGAVSVLVQAVATVTIDRRVPRACFWPRPDVVSALVVIEPDAARRDRLPDTFREDVHRLWSKRRKKLRGVLRELTGWDNRQIDETLSEAGIKDGEQRIERLTVEEFVRLLTVLRRK